MEKAYLRARIRQTTSAISPAARAELSERASNNLLEQQTWHDSHTILAFLAFKDELDLFAAIEAGWASGKTVALPRYVSEQNRYCAVVTSPEEREFVKGAFG